MRLGTPESFRSYVLTRFSSQLVLAALCLLAVSAAAQNTSKITLDSSEAIFSVVAAMRNCGYDAGSTDPFRAQVSGEIAKAVGASREAQAASAEMCRFYRDHQQGESARDLAQYVSLALFLGEPPKFTLKSKESDLPPDAGYVQGFVPLLAHFAETANLHRIWQEHRYQYEELQDLLVALGAQDARGRDGRESGGAGLERAAPSELGVQGNSSDAFGHAAS